MVRTRADNTARRAVAAKAPRKALSSPSPSASPGGIGKDKYCGGNPVRWAPTPSWQKGIHSFFGKSSTNDSGPPSNTISNENNNIEEIEKELVDERTKNTEELATTSNNYTNENHNTDNNSNTEGDTVAVNQQL